MVLSYRLRLRNIVGVRIVAGWFGGFELSSYRCNTIALANHPRWTWVLVEKRWRPRFLAIAPGNPETFVRDIERLPRNPSSRVYK